MKTIYIVISPVTDICAEYALLCQKNRELLSQHGLIYALEEDFRERFSCHEYLGIMLRQIYAGTSTVIELTDRLKKFELLVKENTNDILLFLSSPPRQGMLKILEQAIRSPDLPVLSQYKICSLALLSPQEEILEGYLRLFGPRWQEYPADVEKSYTTSLGTMRYDLLYEDMAKISTESPRVLLVSSQDKPAADHFFAALDSIFSSQDIVPLTDSCLMDRNYNFFAHDLFSPIKIADEPSYLEIAAALRPYQTAHGEDSQTWAPPSCLQHIHEASLEGNRRLAQRLFQRTELFEPSLPRQDNWHPYAGLSAALRDELLAYLLNISPRFHDSIEKLHKCHWLYDRLPAKGKKLFPAPSTSEQRAQEPLLSVLTLTNNQVGMIAQNIESVLNQKTKFPVQHIIVDNASTDGTAEIIAKYAAQHSSIVPLLLKETASKGENIRVLFKQCRSTYAALCDGDDYFTDPNKLQTQVNFLERNKDCALCFHPVHVIYEDGSPSKIYPPDNLLPGGVRLKYSLHDLLGANFIQTNSVVYRWRFRDGLPDWFDPSLLPGDWYWHLLHAEMGSIGYLNKPMSAYRRHKASLYALAEKDHVAHRHRYGLQELHMYTVCNTHFHGRYHKEFSRLARGVFADLVQDYLKTKDDSLLQEGIAAAPDFAKDFLALLSNQNMKISQPVSAKL